MAADSRHHPRSVGVTRRRGSRTRLSSFIVMAPARSLLGGRGLGVTSPAVIPSEIRDFRLATASSARSAPEWHPETPNEGIQDAELHELRRGPAALPRVGGPEGSSGAAGRRIQDPASSWKPQFAALEDAGYRVIAFDRRGHGASEVGPDGSHTMDRHGAGGKANFGQPSTRPLGRARAGRIFDGRRAGGARDEFREA